MPRDMIPDDISSLSKKSGNKGSADSGRRKPHFAEKSYQERAREAYQKYLDTIQTKE